MGGEISVQVQSEGMQKISETDVIDDKWKIFLFASSVVHGPE